MSRKRRNIRIHGHRICRKCCYVLQKKREIINSLNNQDVMNSLKAASLRSTALKPPKILHFHITIDLYLYSEGSEHNTKVISSPKDWLPHWTCRAMMNAASFRTDGNILAESETVFGKVCETSSWGTRWCWV